MGAVGVAGMAVDMRVNVGVGVWVRLRMRQGERKLAGRTGCTHVADGVGVYVVEAERADGGMGRMWGQRRGGAGHIGVAALLHRLMG